MPLPSKAIKRAKQQASREIPLWKGPEKDGITQSLLCRFLCCRERFRLLVVEGLKKQDEFNHRLEYGSMWHVCEESHAANINGPSVDWEVQLERYCSDLCRQYPLQQEQVDHWYNVCLIQFPLYTEYWSKHPDVKHSTALFQEQVFNIPYKLPSKRIVRLRGKWDSVDVIGKGNAARTYLQENKTKGDPNEVQIKRQLSFDLQTMLYLTALQEYYENAKAGDKLFPNDYGPPAGVRYNVVRRPLSGGKGSIRRHKPSKANPNGEGKEHFYDRVAQYIKDDPASYFMRWKVELLPEDLFKFRVRFLVPVLEQLCDWWECMETCKFDPWNSRDRDLGQARHWQYPYGIYNVLNEGGSTSLDDYLATGSKVGLANVNELFTELR
jgi:hypothetical protein